jgi:ABC-type transport system involved in multi-copper enzyme maturation permease subunit
MIWKIAKKELLLNIMTFKYITGTFMCTILIITLLPVLISDYQKRLETYHHNIASNKAELNKVKCYKSLRPVIHRKPALLAIFSRGLEQKIHDSEQIKVGHVPIIQPDTKRVNPYLAIFPSLDISMIIKIIISLLALLMAYDVISGEREHETLKLILSNRISRSRVFLGKYLAGMITLAISLLIAFCTIMIILLVNSMIDLAFSDWLRVGLMFLVYLLLISAMYNIGLFFSSLIRRSSTSLIFSIMCWVVFLFVIPGLSQYMASFLMPVDSREQSDENVYALEEEMENAQKPSSGVLKTGNLWGGPDSFGGFCYDLCEPGPTKYLNECYIYNEPLKLKYADKVWEIKDAYNKSLNKQRLLAQNFSRSSPACLFEIIINSLTNTDYDSYYRYSKELRDYRNRVIDYIKAKTDNFHDISYFTPGQTDEERIEYYATMEGRKKHFEMIKSLNLDDFPPFDYQPRPIKHKTDTA